MAKVRGLNALEKKLKRFLIKELANKALLNKIGEFVKDRIVQFTRSGKSIAGAKAKKLKKLSDSYIQTRRGALHFRTSQQGNVFPIEGPDERLKTVDKEFFDPDFSNLTFTGQLLRSLKAKVDLKARTIDIMPTGNRFDSNLSNQDVAKFVAEQGRPFIGLDDKGIKRVKALIIQDLRKSLRKNNLKK
jgi:hypothetical protein